MFYPGLLVNEPTRAQLETIYASLKWQVYTIFFYLKIGLDKKKRQIKVSSKKMSSPNSLSCSCQLKYTVDMWSTYSRLPCEVLHGELAACHVTSTPVNDSVETF